MSEQDEFVKNSVDSLKKLLFPAFLFDPNVDFVHPYYYCIDSVISIRRKIFSEINDSTVINHIIYAPEVNAIINRHADTLEFIDMDHYYYLVEKKYSTLDLLMMRKRELSVSNR